LSNVKPACLVLRHGVSREIQVPEQFLQDFGSGAFCHGFLDDIADFFFFGKRGLGPRCGKKGDKLCYFLECPLPFVVRELGNG
jgi:hypothetical protein